MVCRERCRSRRYLLEDINEEEIQLNEVKDKKGKGSGTKDACYYKVKSRYSVWPSAYASGALVKCRKVGAANWGNSKKEEVEVSGDNLIEMGTPIPAERIRDTKNIGTPPTKGGDSQRKKDSLPKPEKTTPTPGSDALNRRTTPKKTCRCT